MKDHSGDNRGFTWTGQAWYGKSALSHLNYTDEVTIGYYAEDGGTSGEFSIRWIPLSGESVPKLEVFNDGWHALATMPDLIAALSEADDQNITPAQLCEVLLSLGFRDRTERRDQGRKARCKECGREI